MSLSHRSAAAMARPKQLSSTRRDRDSGVAGMGIAGGRNLGRNLLPGGGGGPGRARRACLPTAILLLATLCSAAVLLTSHRALLRAPSSSAAGAPGHGRGLGGRDDPDPVVVRDDVRGLKKGHRRGGARDRRDGRAGTDTERFAVSNRAATDEEEPSNSVVGGNGHYEGPLDNAPPPLSQKGRVNNKVNDGNGNRKDDATSHRYYRFPYRDAPPPDLDADTRPTPPLDDEDLSAVVERTAYRSAVVNGRLKEWRRRREEEEEEEAAGGGGDGDKADSDRDRAKKRAGGGISILSYTCPLLDDSKYESNFHRYEWYSSASTWEDAGRWYIAPSEFNSMVLQLVRSFPSEAMFQRRDRIYESACGSGLFLTALEDAAEIASGARHGELELSMHGSDIVSNSVDMIRRAVYPQGKGTFCTADSHDLTHVPPNTYDWSVTGFLEPMKTSHRKKAERWMRWWVYHMSRIAKPNGWILVAFNYQPGREHEGVANVKDVNWWRKVRQTSLWRVRPETVQIIWQNTDWPKRKHTRHRYHVLMRRDDTPFGEEDGCDHVKFRAKVDPDYRECRFTDEDPKGYEPLEEFVVAGRNLASYGHHSSSNANKRGDRDAGGRNNRDGNDNNASPPPFQLYRDFYIGDVLTGKESWDDLLKHRRKLASPTASFYADKAAQKTWLSSSARGVDVPRAYALKYASELIGEDDEQGSAEDSLTARIERLLPATEQEDVAAATDYVVKPTHSSGAGGVRLIGQDDKNGNMLLGFQRENLLLPVADDASTSSSTSRARRDLAHRLAEYLTSEPYAGDSAALRNVEPGFVIEERFVTPTTTTTMNGGGPPPNSGAEEGAEHADLLDLNMHPLEFEVLCLWGRVWMSTFRRGETVLGLIRRDGRMADIDSPREVPGLPHWVDWDHVVDIAEKLAKGKDMIRIDVLAGVPAEEWKKKMNAAATEASEGGGEGLHEPPVPLRYAVTEMEFQPVVEWMQMPSDVLEEGARLWIAGYEMGIFELAENTEVPAGFHDAKHRTRR